MTREEFFATLEAHGVDSCLVHIEDGVAEGYGIRKNHLRWETYVRERGMEYDLIGHPSESDALRYLVEKLLALPSIVSQ